MAETKDKKTTIETGNISVHTENIFPIIKRSLYSDHEIFLRELVSNAVDASQKLKHLASVGKFDEEIGDLKVSVEINKEAKTITIRDWGIGMTAEEVKKYINQVAFSGAEEFVKKFKDVKESNQIIGQFGLGFYSAFMVAGTVEIITRSYKKNAPGVRWTCDGSTSYTLEKNNRKERGTDIILHIAEDSEEFLEGLRLQTILNKYCRFLPVPIEFEDNIINKTEAIWRKSPSSLKDEDYLSFFKELYPYAEEPLFWIHLNVDYPFTLNGILFFPRLKSEMEAVKKDRIHLYSRQVFITDSVEQIVPDYLMLLQGVIDSPDIPLNVSRSYLQSDSSVKKISNHISKKVADKLDELFKEDREKFISKWNDIETFVKFGMLSDDKFYDLSTGYCLVQNTEKEYFTLAEYKEKISPNQTDKDENLVYLYANDLKSQDTYITSARRKGFDIALMNNVLDSHFVQLMERKFEKSTWKRVDADTADKLIPKEEKIESLLNEEQVEAMKKLFEETVPEGKGISVLAQPLGSEEMPVVITRPEFMRRMAEMAKTGGMSMMGEMPETLNLILNTSHPMIKTISDRKTKDSQERLANQLTDLALLSQNLLQGQELTAFIERSISLIK